jgi:hypothetical protein
MKRTSWWQGLSVTGGGTGVVAHAGLVAVRLLADRVGLTDRLSQVLARRGFRPAHDRGQVLVDVATMLVGGGEAISDIDTLRHQERLLGPVASPATVWRTLSGLTPAAWKKINTARGKTRGFVWGQLGRLPASRVAGTTLHPDVVVLDADATLVVCHSEKEQASPTYKKTFGYHPLGIWCDNTTELLAIKLRPGSAGSNTAADHIEVLTEAIAQIPAGHRRHLLVRADGAGATHQLLDWLHGLDAKRGRRVEYSVGFPITAAIQDAIRLIPEKVWAAALDADGGVRDGADVAEVTGLIDLTGWPEGMRVIVRREHPHPGAQLSLFEAADGYRYQSFATNTPGSWGFWRPDTAPTPGSRTASGTPRTPAWDASPPASSPSTPPGPNSSQLPPTSPPGSGCSPWRMTLPSPSRRSCATGCCTFPAAWSAADGVGGSGCPTTGPGPPSSWPRSPRSIRCPRPPNKQTGRRTPSTRRPWRPPPQRHAANGRATSPSDDRSRSTSCSRRRTTADVKDRG